MKKKLLVVGALLAITMGGLATGWGTSAAAQANTAAMHHRSTTGCGYFKGDGPALRAWFTCMGFPYDVYNNTGTLAYSVNAKGHRVRHPQMSPRSGGAACSYLIYHAAEFCSQKGGTYTQWVCFKYFAGPYPYHCGPAEAWSRDKAAGMEKALDERMTNISGMGKACAGAAFTGSFKGALIKTVDGPIGWVGRVAGGVKGAAIGCVGGILSFWFWG